MTSYTSRRDFRTEEQFSLSMSTEAKELERYYAESWVDKHNRMRHKLDYCLIPWGARLKGVITEPSNAFNRPDYFLVQLEDNKRVARAIRPLEVCTFKNDDDGKFWIKAFKVDWFYCQHTQLICDAFRTRQQVLLCVLSINNHNKFYPMFTEDAIYKQMLKRGRQPSPKLGGKMSYFFWTNEIGWSLL